MTTRVPSGLTMVIFCSVIAGLPSMMTARISGSMCGVGYLAGASRSAPEQSGDLGFAHTVEIFRHGDLAGQETQPLRLRGSLQRRHLHQRLARLGDHERFSLGGLIDQLRELGLGFMDVDCDHFDSWTKLIGPSLFRRSSFVKPGAVILKTAWRLHDLVSSRAPGPGTDASTYRRAGLDDR